MDYFQESYKLTYSLDMRRKKEIGFSLYVNTFISPHKDTYLSIH